MAAPLHLEFMRSAMSLGSGTQATSGKDGRIKASREPLFFLAWFAMHSLLCSQTKTMLMLHSQHVGFMFCLRICVGFSLPPVHI